VLAIDRLDRGRETVKVCDSRLVVPYLNLIEKVVETFCLPRSDHDSDRRLGSGKGSIAINNRAVLRPVEVEFEDNAMSHLELAANPAGE
jgi:hypothetical protein